MRPLLLVAGLLAACSNDLEKQSQIVKLRVLAVRADPAELILTPDGGPPSAVLTALAVQPDAGPTSMRFALCTRLGDAPPPTLPCPGEQGIDLPDAGPNAATLDLNDPRILAFAAQAQLDGGTFDAGGVAQSLAEGVPLLVGFAATALPAQRLDGFETVTLRTPERGPANLNPELRGLTLALARSDFDVDPETPLPEDGTASVAVKALTHLTPVAAAKDDPSKRYGYSFFATAGEIGSLRSTDTTSTGEPAPTWVKWTAPATPQQVRFWVVVRDGRGGTAWIERSLNVR